MTLGISLSGPFYFASPYKHAVVAIIMIIVRQMQWNVEWKEKQIPKWRRDKNNNPTSIGKSWAVAMARTRHTKLSILMLDRWAVVPQCAAISTESSLRFIVLHWTGFFCHSQCLGCFFFHLSFSLFARSFYFNSHSLSVLCFFFSFYFSVDWKDRNFHTIFWSSRKERKIYRNEQKEKQSIVNIINYIKSSSAWNTKDFKWIKAQQP